MSRERPETWDEIDGDRLYWDKDDTLVDGWFLINSVACHRGDPIEALLLVPTREEWEAAQRLAEFGRQMLAEVKECIVEGGFSMDSETVADKAVKCGLMQYMAYDPAKHGPLNPDYAEYEPGDMIYYWGDEQLAGKDEI